MSYAICRIQKCGSSHDIAGIQIHDRRERSHSNSNPDIDFERSHDNYSLCDNAVGSSFNEYIDKQLAERYTGNKAIRKDAVRMVQVLFTSDSDFFDQLSAEQAKDYFQSCYDWAAKRWGADNIISADIHLDEKTPHMHLNFVPLTADGRLSAKECIGSGSKALQQLQDDFYREVGAAYGLDRGRRADLISGEQPRKHQRVAEYKASTEYYQSQKNELQAASEALQDEVSALTDIIHAEPHDVPEGLPVPSMAKPFVGKENRDKLLYTPDEIAHVHELSKAVAIASADLNRKSTELDRKQADFDYQREQWTESHGSDIWYKTAKSYKTEVAEAEKKLEQLRTEAEAIISEANSYAQQQREFYAERFPYVQQMIADKKELRSNLKAAEDEVKRLKDFEGQVSELQHTNKELTEQINTLTTEITEKTAILEELKEKSKDVPQLIGENKSLQTSLNTALEELSAEKKHKAEQEQQINKLQLRLKPMEQHNRELTEQVSTLTAEIAEKTADLEELTEKSKDVPRLIEQNKSLQSIVQHWKEKTQDYKNLWNESKQEIKEINHKWNQDFQKAHDLECENTRLTKQIDGLTAEKESSAAEVEKLNSQYTELAAEYNRVAENMRTLYKLTEYITQRTKYRDIDIDDTVIKMQKGYEISYLTGDQSRGMSR